MKTAPTAGRPRKIPLNSVQRIIRLYQEGRSLLSIGTEYGTSFTAIADLLERNGIKRRRRGCPTGVEHDGKLTVYQRQQLRDRIAECWGKQIDIAEEYGVSREYVRQQAEVIGCTWYMHGERKARNAPRMQAKAQAIKAQKQAKRDARMARFLTVSRMWKDGASSHDLGAHLNRTAHQALTWISHLRARYPDLFPHAHTLPTRG